MHFLEVFLKNKEEHINALLAKKRHLIILSTSYRTIIDKFDPEGGLYKEVGTLRVQLMRKYTGSSTVESCNAMSFENFISKMQDYLN